MIDIKETLQKAIQKAGIIAVFSGAGISTSCGIPDFRGPEGIYSTVQQRYNLPMPESIFDLSYFRENPVPFFDFSREMFTKEVHPSLTHHYLAELEKEGKEISIVTQNIDMLHGRAGSTGVIACHGSYRTGRCMDCDKKYTINDYEDSLKTGTVPKCGCGGVVKPDIVFFGEQLPENFFEIYNSPPAADLILVLGSSLSVQPAARYPLRLMQHRPEAMSILINNEPTPYDDYFTLVIHRDIDETFKSMN